jgi:Barstar (barnase inhibitor)
MDPLGERLQLIRALRSVDSLPFIFVSSGRDFTGRVARIPATVSDVDELLRVVARELQFPDYFGNNWDALQDCLRDLSWLSDSKVVLYHEGLPRDLGEADIATYLEILLTTVREREMEETCERELVVVFPRMIVT